MNGTTNGEEEAPTQAPQDTGVGPFLGEALSRFARKPDQKSQLAELPDTKNIDQQIASFNQFLESASPLNEWHKNKVLARFGEMPQPVQGQMPQGAPMPQISPEPASQPGQPSTPSGKPSQQQQAPAAAPAGSAEAHTGPAAAPTFLNPATGSYEPLQTTAPATPQYFLNPATGSYEPLQTPPSASTNYQADFEPDTSGSKRINAIFNNPGALGLAPWQESKYGATASGKYDTGHPFAQFPTKEAGGAAQFDLWSRSSQFAGQTLRNAITNWIGPGEHGEAEFISQKTGIPLDQPITQEFLRSPQGIQLMQAQAQYEGQNVLSQDQWQAAQNWAYNGIVPGAQAATQ